MVVTDALEKIAASILFMGMCLRLALEAHLLEIPARFYHRLSTTRVQDRLKRSSAIAARHDEGPSILRTLIHYASGVTILGSTTLVLPSRRVKLDVKSIRFGNDQNRFNSKLRFESSCTSLGSRFTIDLAYFHPYIVIPCQWPQAHTNIITMSCSGLDILRLAATPTSKELYRPFSELRINGPTSFEVLNSQWTQSGSTIWELSYYIDIGLDKLKQYINETRIHALSMSASQFFVAY